MSEWTKTPPTEAGYYWWQSKGIDMEIKHIQKPFGDLSVFGRNGIAYSPESYRGLWWPERIKEPDGGSVIRAAVQ